MLLVRFLAFLPFLACCLALVNQPNFANIITTAQSLDGSPIEKRDSLPAGYVATPYYPTPKGGWVSNWTSAYAKAKIVVANM
jgi:beta-glucosidase